MRRLALLSFVVLLLFATLSHAATREETWMSVTLDGRKIGHMHNLREVRDGRIVTTQMLNVQLERAGMSIGLISSETSEETPSGKPLAFSARSQLSGMETATEGHLRHDGQVEVTTTVGGAKQTRMMAWPSNALLAEGLRLHGLKAGLEPETTYEDLAFQPSNTEAVKVTTRVRGKENIDLPDGRRELVAIEQTIHLPGISTATVGWVDAQQNVHKLVMDLLGFRLEMLTCSQTCATAPNQSADMLQHALLAAPRALSPTELRHGLTYTLTPVRGDAPIEIATTDEQHVERHGTQIRLRVASATRTTAKDTPTTADRAPNAWLQSDAPEIIALAREGAGAANGHTAKMKALESFVRGYIREKNLSVGYASALEVAKTREGDCTEHAVLLAALGRALGIPTRVVDGLAYTNRFGDTERVFVPHAWVHAWIDDRWQSFDAALNGFDAGHIALSVGDGDPWRFYAGLGTLGNLKLEHIEPITTP